MAAVTKREAELLTVAQAVMGAAPFDSVQKLLLVPCKAPQHIGPTAAGLLKDTLSKGAVLALAKGGGYRRGEQGRWWERQSPATLDFGGATVRTLQWLLEMPLGDATAQALKLEGPLGLGDELFLFQLLKLTQGSPAWKAIAVLEPVRQSPLCSLGFAFSLGMARAFDVSRADEWIPSRLQVVDAWQLWLAKLWDQAESEKAKVVAPAQLQAGGTAQQQVLEPFLNAIDSAGKRSLSVFLIQAALSFVPREGRAAGEQIGASLSPSTPLRERQEARRAAAAPYRALARLFQWDQEHRNLRFIDDGYADAQRMVKAYDALGERGFRAAASILENLENTV